VRDKDFFPFTGKGNKNEKKFSETKRGEKQKIGFLKQKRATRQPVNIPRVFQKKKAGRFHSLAFRKKKRRVFFPERPEGFLPRLLKESGKPEIR